MAYTKGQIITLDGKEYRIIKLNGSVAEVVGMTNASDSQQFAASGQIYAGSTLDTYLNSTFYATLSDKLKAAIVDKTFTQDSWYPNTSGDPDYSGHSGTTKPGTSAYSVSLGTATFGVEITRHVYALSVQDVLDYVLDTSITDGQLQNYNVWKMFWNDEVQHTSNSNQLWFRSKDASSTGSVFIAQGDTGRVTYGSANNDRAVRPAFKIDLDVYFSLWADENFKTILFGDNAGTDAQNAQLIGYLSENADPSAVTTFDLTSLGLSAGDHTIKVKATATGYADSDFSNSVTYNVVVMPSKGDIITMNVDGTDKQFRVLKVNDTIAEVMAMFNTEQGASNGTYFGSTMDQYLNITWYGTLNSTAKNAIVDKSFAIEKWTNDASGSPQYSGYRGTSKPGTIAYSISYQGINDNENTRHIYIPSLRDILDYILDTSVDDGLLQNYNLWKMFWNDEVQHTGDGGTLHIATQDSTAAYQAYILNGSQGFLYNGFTATNSAYSRAMFQIDLTKISWSPAT